MLPDFDRVSPFHLGEAPTIDNSKSLAYELGARDSVAIFARRELLITGIHTHTHTHTHTYGRASPGG